MDFQLSNFNGFLGGKKKSVRNPSPSVNETGQSFLLIVTEAELTDANRSGAAAGPRSRRGDGPIDPRQRKRRKLPVHLWAHRSAAPNTISGSLSETLISITPLKLNVISPSKGSRAPLRILRLQLTPSDLNYVPRL